MTSVERDANGRATAIQSPDGLRTLLSYHANGLLSQVDSVENRSWKLAYDSDAAKFGLLSRFENPRTHASVMAWGNAGRLSLDTNPEGGFTRLVRSQWGDLDARSTLLQTAEGRQRRVWSNNRGSCVIPQIEGISCRLGQKRSAGVAIEGIM